MMEMDLTVANNFADRLRNKLDGKFTIHTEVDRKGMICSWCKLENATDITKVAQLVAEYKGRIITISTLNTLENEKSDSVIINYHFYFERVNCTVSITLPDAARKVNSITPILKSADWHEREMAEFFKIKLIGHPNPRPLFLDKSIPMEANTMVPLSAAMNGSSTSTLWERVMKSSAEEEE